MMCVCSEMWGYLNGINAVLNSLTGYAIAKPDSVKQLLKKAPAKLWVSLHLLLSSGVWWCWQWCSVLLSGAGSTWHEAHKSNPLTPLFMAFFWCQNVVNVYFSFLPFIQSAITLKHVQFHNIWTHPISVDFRHNEAVTLFRRKKIFNVEYWF